MPYFNTNNLFGEELKAAEKITQSQDEMVLECYKKLSIPAGPSMIYKYLINTGKIGKKTPITSLRRSITSLTKDGLLKKTEKRVMGDWGQKEHMWILNEEA